MVQFSRILRILKTPEEPPVEWILRPFQRFSREEAAGGILLLLCAAAALTWANSAWASSYESLWETHLRLEIGDFSIDEPLHFWINDTIMAVFFFVIGLEIKRELIAGELSSPRRAALPVMAALGGMLVPALIYTAFNAGAEGSTGWGIPMATDIAFSLGVLALMGARAPLTLKVFIAAFAIVDDIGAILVIALFFTEDISWINLAVGGGLLGVLVLANWIGVVNTFFFALVGAAVWFAFVQSGIHATVAGVLIATTIPTRVQISSSAFLSKTRALLSEFERAGEPGSHDITTADQTAAIHDLELACQDVESPLQRMEHALHPWVVFAVMPLFALANSGVSLDSGMAGSLTERVSLGIVFGLVVGKPVGIILFTWLAVRTGLSPMPTGLTWRHISGVACLGGIGFTMSLFITGLAFSDAALISQAKLGILAGSIVSGVGAWMILRGCQSKPERRPFDSA